MLRPFPSPQKTKTIIYVTLPDVESEIFIIKKAKEKKNAFDLGVYLQVSRLIILLD